ncbi:MAG: methyl-accepting chemotaxis protein [Defluviitaleaceae bacterium]|nr:methyl-accepting chemotaxis protein [Defluviitaleaceae bacterium]
MKNVSIKVKLGLVMGIIIAVAMSLTVVARAMNEHSSRLTIAEDKLANNVFMTMVVFDVMAASPRISRIFDVPYETGNFFTLIVDLHGRVIFSHRDEYVGRNIVDLNIAEAVTDVPMDEMFEYVSEVTGNRELAFASSAAEIQEGWFIMSGVDRDSATATTGEIIVAVAPTVIGISLGTVLMLFMVVRMLRPLKSLTDNAKEISRGNVAVNLKTDSGDEMGLLSRAFMGIVASLNTMTEEIKNNELKIRHGDLNHSIENFEMEGIFKEILTGVNSVTEELMEYLAAVNSPIIVIDKEYRLMFINTMAAKLSRKDPREVTGQDAELFFGCDISLIPAVSRCVNTGERGTDTELQFQLAPDTLFEMDLQTVPCKTKSGEIVAVAIFLADFTEIRQSTRHDAKLNDYRNAQSAKLTQSIAAAFEQGNLELTIPPSEFDNDTKAIAAEYKNVEDILQKSVGTIKGYIDELTDTLHAMSRKDFDRKITSEYTGDFTAIKDSVNIILNDMNTVLSELLGSTMQVRNGTRLISDSAQKIAGSVGQQVDAMSDISRSVSTVAEQVNANMETVEAAAASSAEARQSADRSNVQMKEMLAAMEEIRTSSNTIANIIKTIEDIAFQTNLLALNASVEAARAGEHGKGFAVVAEEVRNLAARSADAVRESSALIQTSLEKVDSGAMIAEATADTLGKIMRAVSSIDSTVGQITASSVEQTRAVTTIEQAVSSINQMIKQTSDEVQQNAATTQEVTSQAEVLQSMVAEFKLRR